MKIREILYSLSIFTIVSGFILVGVFWYWSFYPYKVLEFGEGNGTISQKEVKAGDYVELLQKGCKLLDYPATVNRQFIDGIVYQAPIIISNRPAECFDKKELIYVPKALAPGTYHINTVLSFKVNPIRIVSYTIATNEFTVIK